MDINKIKTGLKVYAEKQKRDDEISNIVNFKSLDNVLELFNKDADDLIDRISDDTLDDYIIYLTTEARDNCVIDNRIRVPFFFSSEAYLVAGSAVTIHADTQMKFSSRYFDRIKSYKGLNVAEENIGALVGELRKSKYFKEDGMVDYQFLFDDDNYASEATVRGKLQESVYDNISQRLLDYGLRVEKLESFNVLKDTERIYRLNFNVVVLVNNPVRGDY